jgi:hypothetical protein
MKERFYLNGLLDLYSIFLYRDNFGPTVDVVWNGSADGELSKRNVNQANAMLSLSPCAVPVEYLYLYQNRITPSTPRRGDRR